ncbi:phage terminase large subunit [Pseudogracilibacillus sp. SO30301A]|uniref:phage terminase large subunit n=1 Tax=Pseudogracilibacillus sp. SO30301A TaxID=3098291 RepID=UPI00300E4336
MNLTNVIAPAFYELHHEVKQNMNHEYWLKGGRGSTKSTFASVEILIGMLSDADANAVVFRRYQNVLRETVFGQFEWSANKLGIAHTLKFQVSPMQIIFPTGQKIVFKAADNPRKLKSVNLGRGYN